MKIISLRTNNGPTVYHSRPTLVMTVDLGEFHDTGSHMVQGLTESLLKDFPGLKEHTCSPGRTGGFVERLTEGTYPAHIIEHVAIELSAICGIEVHFGKTRYAGREGLYDICTTFLNEEGMKECLRQAFKTVHERLVVLLNKKPHDIQSHLMLIHQPNLQKIRKIVSLTALGPSGLALLTAAKVRGIPILRLGNDSVLQLGYGKNRRYVQAAVTSGTSLIAKELAQDKSLTKEILTSHFLPVPKGVVIESEEELTEHLVFCVRPCAIKPVDGNHGRGVSLNLKTDDQIREAFQTAQKISPRVIVEEMCQGHDYRLCIVNYQLVAAAERKPACIIGDGESTLADLIQIVNADPRRADGHLGLLTKIEPDEVMYAHLKKMGVFTLDHIPEKGSTVYLRDNANISSGGTAVDVTDSVHPEVRILCERAARAMGLDVCGIDLMHTDITKPPGLTARIIEVNAGPGLRMHLAPSAGKPRDVGGAIIDMLYPQADLSRIPIIAVTGTNGKTTTARLLHHIFSDQRGDGVGVTTSDGIWLGQKKIIAGDTTGPKSARLLLSDPAVEFAVLEVARGGMLRGGLGYDWSDVGVITNIQADHLGQDGIESIEDIVWVKSLVAEHVRPGGTLVLNADDPYVLSIRSNKRVCENNPRLFLFSGKSDNHDLLHHIYAGNDACWVEEGYATLQYNGVRERLFHTEEMPLTLQGAADFQNLNLMAAVGAALAAGADKKKMLKSLRSYSTNQNGGRMNMYRIRDSYVVLDYGHNPEAFLSVGRMLEKFPGYHKTAVVGLPGDRSDALLEKSAEALAGHFDSFILKDDFDLRGRAMGEVPRLLKKRFQELDRGLDARVIISETEAVETALNGLGANEIVFVFHDRLPELMPVLLKHDPHPVEFIPQLKFTPTQTEKEKIYNETEARPSLAGMN